MYRELGHDWDIGSITAYWEVENFPTGNVIVEDPVFFGNEGTDDYHPDIAIDPATGDKHIVWTGYCGTEYHPYRLNYVRYDYAASEWSDQEMIYESEYDYAAWAPRIAIGNAGGDFGEVVGIVYSSFSGQENHYARDHWHIGLAYWDIDNEGPQDAKFIHFSSDELADAGFPRIGLAPRLCDYEDGCGSIVFARNDGGDPITFKVMEINNIRNSIWEIDDTGNGGFFGAVSIHYPNGDPEASLSYFDRNTQNGWKVRVGRFLLEDDSPSPAWPDIDTYILGELTYDDFIDFLTIETFQAGDIVTISSGGFDNAYWVGFCDYIDSGASCVKVAYGYSE